MRSKNKNLKNYRNLKNNKIRDKYWKNNYWKNKGSKNKHKYKNCSKNSKINKCKIREKLEFKNQKT
jgi:hypothetical protein